MRSFAASIVTACDIEMWLKQHVASLVGLSPEAVSSDAEFESFGMDSVQGVEMLVALETWLDMPDDISMDLLFEASSIGEAARWVAEAKMKRAA